MSAILVVEHDQPLRAWLRRILEDNGYAVEEASDGNEAVAGIRRQRPDLMLLDIYMPYKGGLESILRLRSQRPSVMILAVVGEPIPGYDAHQTVRSLGAHGPLTKPFNAEAVVQQVQKLLAYS